MYIDHFLYLPFLSYTFVGDKEIIEKLTKIEERLAKIEEG
jgi:hypothetical protein